MSPRLRGLKAREVIAALVRAGGRVEKGKGDHLKVYMPNGSLLVVCAVGEVGIGLLKDLLRRADMSEEEFLGYLR